MPTHAEIYRRVCLARPECAVVRGPHKLTSHTKIGWFAWLGTDASTDKSCDSEDALALITDFWTEMLPEGFCLARNNKKWIVGKDMDDTFDASGLTRFHALAEFLVPGSTKEKA